MMHVRVVSPPLLTGDLAGWLGSEPGVANVVVHPGAARRPGGDAVQFDVETGGANAVFARLRRMGLDGAGPICVEQVDAALVRRGASRSGSGPLRRERAPVWEMVEATIRAGEEYPPSFYVLLTIAGLIGAVGILTNSQILVVGAMVVGPEYGAIIAVALAMGRRDGSAVRDGLLALFWGFLGAVLVTGVFAVAVRAAGVTPAAFRAGLRPVSSLIGTPNVFSVVVATLAGIVGVVSLTEARTNALIGVFISVTTIPAAADVGVSLAYGSPGEAWGSTLQLLLNVALLLVVGAAGLALQRRIWTRHRPP
jgi:uncharacterized hydrophobic protein (TIGR00271 family)